MEKKVGKMLTEQPYTYITPEAAIATPAKQWPGRKKLKNTTMNAKMASTFSAFLKTLPM